MLRGGGIGSDAGSSLTQTVEETAQTDTESEAVEDGESADANDSHAADADVENTDATETDVTDADGNTADESAADDGGAATYSAESADGNESNGDGSNDVETYADNPVARIGDDTYDSLDEAIAEAEDGDTITLLADATVSQSLDKTITIDGQGQYTLTSTDARYGFSAGTHVTFENVTANFVYSIEIENPGYTSDLAFFYVNGDTDFTFKNSIVNITNTDTGATNRLHGFYYDGGSVGTITLDSTDMTITGLPEDAFEWSGNSSNLIIKSDSTLVCDSNRSGITGTWNVTVSDSALKVLNSAGNGSNGSNFYIDNSTVAFINNQGHGLSAGALEISDSDVTSEDNDYIGVAVGKNLAIKDNSTVTVSGNAKSENYGYAAMRLYNDYGFVVDGTSKLYVNNNYNTGLYVRQGDLTVEDGAVLEIMGNVVGNNLLDGYGGGLYVGYGANYDPTVTLPADAKIYNNHARTAGDDIYVSEGKEGPSLMLGRTGDGWSLDGGEDCGGEWHMIDGWYDDSEESVTTGEDGVEVTSGGRWMAHAEDAADNHVEVFDDFDEGTGLATVTGLTALKAAHGVDWEPAVTVDVTGLKVVENGDDVDFDEPFVFTLESDDEDAPMPAGVASAEVYGAGLIDLGAIVFNAASVDWDDESRVTCDEDGNTCWASFTYTVTESGEVANVTNDANPVKSFTVTLTSDGSSVVPSVSYEADESAAGYDDGTLFVFTNTYVAPAEPEEPAGEETPTEEETPTDTTDTTAEGEGDEIAKTGASLIVPAVVVVLLLAVAAVGVVLRRRANR